MSYLQIYQEKIYDLLNANSKVDIVLREDPKKGIGVQLNQLSYNYSDEKFLAVLVEVASFKDPLVYQRIKILL